MFILASAARCWLYELFAAFLKAALLFCLEDASMPGSYGVRKRIVPWETWSALQTCQGCRDGEQQKRGQSAEFTFVLLSLSTRTGNAPKVLVPGWRGPSLGCWSLKVSCSGKMMKAAEWPAVPSSESDTWWGLKHLGRWTSLLSMCLSLVELQVERSLCGSQRGVWHSLPCPPLRSIQSWML